MPAALFAAGAAESASAQGPLSAALSTGENVKVSGSVRVRWEGLTGQVRPGLNAEDGIVAVRTTLFGEYDTGTVRFGAELYDSRVYGAGARSMVGANDVNVAEFVQAYVAADFETPLGKGSAASVQAGRFTVNLGSRRLVAADDYRNTTNGFTGIRADFKTGGGTAGTLLFVLPQVRLPDDLPSILDHQFEFDRESFDLRLWGGIASRQNLFPGVTAEASYLRLEERDSPGRPTRDRRLHTVGARLIRDPAPGKMDFEVEAIRQFGSISSGIGATAGDLAVRAAFYHADAGYTFAGKWNPRLSLEYDRATGDGPGRRYGRFDTLYGMRRADLGPAGLYAALGRANISTPGLRVEAAPGSRTDLFASYRLLWAEEATDIFSTTGVRDPAGASGRYAGQQIEGRVRHWIVPKLLRAEVNAVWLGKGRFLRQAPNAPDTGDTFYASVAATASF
ncbi:MAG TPA: alginate export family protein [Allosphingosinicella sp.]